MRDTLLDSRTLSFPFAIITKNTRYLINRKKSCRFKNYESHNYGINSFA